MHNVGRHRAMHYRDLLSPDEKWDGLLLTVERRPSRWQYSGAQWHLRVARDGAPVLWARVLPWGEGVAWVLAGLSDTSPLAPITAAEVRANSEAPRSRAWFARWARHFAAALYDSKLTPLHEGLWQIAEPRVGAHELHTLDAYKNQPSAGVAGWDPTTGGRGSVVGLRLPSTVNAGRVKAWRKFAADGALPPVLLWFIKPLDLFLVLDGHERLLAATLEGVEAPLLAISAVRELPRTPSAPMQQAIQQRYLLEAEGAKDPRYVRVPMDRLNALASEAYEDRPLLVSALVGEPQELPAWRAEVEKRLDALKIPKDADVRRRLLNTAAK